MSKKTMAVVLSVVMGVAFTSFAFLGCGDDETPRPIELVPVPQAVTIVPVGSSSILGLLDGLCFNFPSGAFLNPALAGVAVEVCYEATAVADRVRVTMETPSGGFAVAEEYLGSLFLQINTSTIPGVVPGLYEAQETVLIASDGSAVKTFQIGSGDAGSSDNLPGFCSVLECVGMDLVCDGVTVGDCIVTGSFGG